MNNLRNKVTLVGFLGNDPQIKSLESGSTLAKFSIATNEAYVNGQGEKVNTTTWHSCVAWNRLAEICEKLLKKGSEVIVEGKIINRNYDDSEGNRKYITEIQVHEMLLVGNKASERNEEPEPLPQANELAVLDK